MKAASRFFLAGKVGNAGDVACFLASELAGIRRVRFQDDLRGNSGLFFSCISNWFPRDLRRLFALSWGRRSVSGRGRPIGTGSYNSAHQPTKFSVAPPSIIVCVSGRPY